MHPPLEGDVGRRESEEQIPRACRRKLEPGRYALDANGDAIVIESEVTVDLSKIEAASLFHPEKPWMTPHDKSSLGLFPASSPSSTCAAINIV
jgi:hypothetical protein